MINPFSPRYPANPDYFVNRIHIQERFQQMVYRSAKAKPPTPDNIAVLGAWGMGKTSMLRRFEHWCLAQKDLKIFTAIVELNPNTCKSLEAFSARTRDEIERSFNISDIKLISKLKQEWLPNWRLKTIDFGIGALERNAREIAPTTALEDSFRELWSILEKNKVDVAIIMFDDLHYMAQNYPDGLYDIRGIFQGLPKDGCNFMLAASGIPSLFQVASDFAEPFTRFFDRFYLEPFGQKETEKFIKIPLQKTNPNLVIEKDILEKIFELTQGHPFFLSFIMYDLISYASMENTKNIDQDFFKDCFQKIFHHLSNEKFREEFNRASDTEKKVLEEMSYHSDIEISPGQIKIPNTARYLKHLSENKGLLTKYGRGKYKFYHPLFREYVKKFK
ncbi:P-loop NTPase fold protein [Candidatus Margulisiibacteriota bacterium]